MPQRFLFTCFILFVLFFEFTVVGAICTCFSRTYDFGCVDRSFWNSCFFLNKHNIGLLSKRTISVVFFWLVSIEWFLDVFTVVILYLSYTLFSFRKQSKKTKKTNQSGKQKTHLITNQSLCQSDLKDSYGLLFLCKIRTEVFVQKYSFCCRVAYLVICGIFKPIFNGFVWSEYGVVCTH